MSYADDKRQTGTFQQSWGHNSKINDPIWPVFKFMRDFIHVPLIIKFQEDPIKTKGDMLITKSNRGFFSNHGDITLKFMISFFNSSEIPPMSTLPATFRKIHSKLNADDIVKQRFFQQSMRSNSKINDPIWPVFKFIWDFIEVPVICKFQEDPTKLNELC